MIRSVLIGAALLSPFLFPYPATFVFSFVAALFFPPMALVSGFLIDVLYLSDGWPIATITGLILSGIAVLVRRFVKARIMGGDGTIFA